MLDGFQPHRLFANVRNGHVARFLNRDLHRRGSSATYVGDNRVLVKCLVGNRALGLFVEADDKLITPQFVVTGCYEKASTRFLSRAIARDSHCLDIGANFGYFTCLMAQFAKDGIVIGVEPIKHLCDMVRDNLKINGLHHAQWIHAAISDQAGELRLYRRWSRSGNTSISPVGRDFTEHFGEDPVQGFTVRALRIDDLQDQLRGRLDFSKVDVEGAEPLVFRGAHAMLSSNPGIRIIIEWSPGQIQAAGFDIGDFIGELGSYGFRFYDIEKIGGLARRLIAPHPRRLSEDELRNLPYRAGLLLSRA
ncbi:FkbM family methyltransferase [Sphingomonas morindae]|uniref:FkbM family methyltransferase n=1 Tax=Sphingomonas morindae TaxID=1541170 RepID=A0ABY4X584_9SPHN|nr:FkbM family methyltransferase [Sphingomonas morindae]USI72057.1 FkbM family methyltransferase [Sphingomonas morindae]